jgi:predicted acyltransferase
VDAGGPLKPAREPALDALRGLAVLGMVLSGHIAFGTGTSGDPAGVLPAWMYHAQLPPPSHKYQPLLAGLTWVDLVFPMFLFALGVAIPLALGRLADEPRNAQGRPWTGTLAVAMVALRRGVLLLFVAIFFQHLKPAHVATTTLAPFAQPLALLALLALALLCAAKRWPWRLAGLLLALALLAALRTPGGDAAFSLKRSDIILVVLANMALVGTLLWWWTRQLPLWRWALLLPLAFVLYGAKAPESVNAWLLQASPLPWAANVAFFKYLVIVLPGSWLGERLREAASGGRAVRMAGWVGMAAAVPVVLALYGLQTRHVAATLLVCGSLAALLAWREAELRPAAGLLICGLLLEPLEGGIRKDGLNLSYVLVTAALAWFALHALRAMREWPLGAAVLRGLCSSGRNAVLAYVLAAWAVLPLLHLVGLHGAWSGLNGNPFEAVLRGLLVTAAVAGLVALANRRGWVLKL